MQINFNPVRAALERLALLRSPQQGPVRAAHANRGTPPRLHANIRNGMTRGERKRAMRAKLLGRAAADLAPVEAVVEAQEPFPTFRMLPDEPVVEAAVEEKDPPARAKIIRKPKVVAEAPPPIDEAEPTKPKRVRKPKAAAPAEATV